MALRDVRNYKFLFNAIEQKFRNPNLVSFKGIPYEPQTNPKSIFGTIYSTFRELIGKGLNLHQYLDIGNRSVLENLYRNLNSDLNLKFLARPGTVLNDPKLELSAQYYQELPPEMTAAQQAEQFPTGAATGTIGMPTGLPSMPTAPRISIPRFTRAPKETPLTAKTPEPTPPKPQLVTATTTGAIKEPPPSKIFVADKSGKIVGEHKIPSFRPPASFINTAKNLGSRIGVFFKKNIGKYLTVGRIATGVSAGIGAITGGALTGGSPIGILGGGGLGALAPSWIKSGGGTNFFKKVGNGAINFGTNLSNRVSYGRSGLPIKAGGNKFIWIGLGLVILLVIGTTIISTTTQTETPPALPGGGTVPGGEGPGNIVFYCQGNTQWQSICSLGDAGCGPTSLAIILSSFGVNINPVQVDQMFQQLGARSCSNAGSSMSLALNSSWLSGLGFEVAPTLVNGTNLNIDQAKKYLDAGYLILASSQSYPCASCKSTSSIDHIFVVDAINTATQTVDIRDPNNCSYTDGDDENLQNRSKTIIAFPWYYAFPIKKVR